MILTASNSNLVLSRFKVYQNIHHLFIAGFVLFFLLQCGFWFQSEKFKPNVNIIPPLPSAESVAVLSFGDGQFYFRVAALRIENAGDSFGRFTALKQYDYAKLYDWLKLLDGLDHKSKYVPSLAANYYSQTQNKEDTRYIVKYLEEYVGDNIDEDWWWIYQAFYIANATLKDDHMALNLAYKLSKNKNDKAPNWTRELVGFVAAKLGDDCEAFAVINKMLQDDKSGQQKIAPDEMEFMRIFIKDKLTYLKDRNFNPHKCVANK